MRKLFFSLVATAMLGTTAFASNGKVAPKKLLFNSKDSAKKVSCTFRVRQVSSNGNVHETVYTTTTDTMSQCHSYIKGIRTVYASHGVYMN